MFRIRFRVQVTVFPIVLHTLFVLLPIALAKSMECRHCNLSLFCCEKPSVTLVLLYFLSTSCLLPVSEDMRFEPTIGLCSRILQKESTPQGGGGVVDGFSLPLCSSHCCHTFFNVRRVSHDHLNDRKSRPSLIMTILTLYR